MDYNWLENVPSSLTPIPVYQPDFSFLQSMQMKANQQYEQGFKQIKSAYSSIFDKSVTGEEATKRQQDYAKQARDQMKTIAASDLSDPKNVLAAENIIAPFYKDAELVKNIGLTSHNETQFARLEAMRTSKDKEERLLYRSWVAEYLNQGVEELASTPMTKEAYAKLEKREAFPVYDIGADAAKEFEDLYGKDGITTVDANGNVMTTYKNGPKSVAAYSTLYKSIASREKYAPQQRAYALTEMGRAIKKIKQDNPNISNEQAKIKFGENAVNDLTTYYGRAISDANKAALEIRNKNTTLISLDANGWPVEGTLDLVKDKQKIEQILSNYRDAKKYQDLADQYKKDFTSSFGFIESDKNRYSTNPFDFSNAIDMESQQYKKTVGDIKTNPEDYIRNVYIDHDADKWAKGKAVITTVKYEENPITKAYNEQANKQFDQQLKLLQFQAIIGQKDRAFDLEQVKLMQKLGIPMSSETLDKLIPDYPGYQSGDEQGVFSATTGFGGAGASGGSKGRTAASIGSGKMSAPGTDNIKVPTKENFDLDQIQRINTVNSLSFSLEGNLQMLSTSVMSNGLKSDEIISLATDLQNCVKTGNYSMKPEAVALRQKFVDILNDNKLNDYTRNGTLTNPNDFRLGLSALVNSSTTQNFFMSADPKKISAIQTIARNNKIVEKEMENYLNYDKLYKDNINKFLTENNKKGQFNKILNSEGVPYTTGEMSVDFPTVTAMGPDGKTIEFSQADLATMWQNGKTIKDIPGIQKVNGKPVQRIADANGYLHTVYYNGVKYSNGYGGNFDNLNVSLSSKYGKPEETKKLLDRISQDVIQKIPGYSTGLSGSVMTYDLSGEGKEIDPTQKSTGVQLAQEALVPVNHDKIYTVGDDNKEGDQLSKEMKAALIDHTSWQTLTDLAESVSVHPYGPNGKRAIEIVFSPAVEKDKKTKIGNVAATDIKALGKVYIDISDDAKGDVINDLPQQKSSYRYGQLLYSSDPLTQDGFEENSGFRYKIMPDPQSKDVTGRHTRAHIISDMWVINDDGTVKVKDDGSPVWYSEENGELVSSVDLMVGNNPKSPNDIERDINNWMNKNLSKRLILRKSNQQTSQAGEQVVKINELLKQNQLR
jgi:hypothetical protein